MVRRITDEMNTGRGDTAVGYSAIEETEEAYRIHIDIEDADPEEVIVDVDEDSIQVSAGMEEPVDLPEGTLDKEGLIYRKVLLPGNVDVDGIEFSMEDGHLDVIVPKTEVRA